MSVSIVTSSDRMIPEERLARRQAMTTATMMMITNVPITPPMTM